MGRKYTIELEEKPFFNEKGNALYRVKGFRSLVFDEQGIEMLEPYKEQDITKLREDAFSSGYARAGEDARKLYIGEKQEAYQKGLDDAWECAKRLFLGVHNGGFANSEIKEIFGDYDYEQVVMKHTAAEAIEKIREHEGIIKVGDEVEAPAGKAVIIQVFGNSKDVRYMYSDASTGFNDSCNITRTGRHFPEIAEIFKKMKGESNDQD